MQNLIFKLFIDPFRYEKKVQTIELLKTLNQTLAITTLLDYYLAEFLTPCFIFYFGSFNCTYFNSIRVFISMG